MAGIERLVATEQLKTNRLAEIVSKDMSYQPHSIRYDSEFDALLVLLAPPQGETIVHYVDDHVALIYEADSMEIVGMQIEAFEHAFLPKHATIQRVWRLSDTGIKLEDFGDLSLAVEQMRPRVVHEIVKATQKWLGPQGDKVVAAFT
jgi:hypothetical protein